MASIKRFFNQTLTIYSKTGYNSQGRVRTSSGTDVAARIQKTTKRKMMPDGNLITIDAIVYVAGDTTVVTEDRVDYSGQKYTVLSIYEVVDKVGASHHLKIELIKYKEV